MSKMYTRDGDSYLDTCVADHLRGDMLMIMKAGVACRMQTLLHANNGGLRSGPDVPQDLSVVSRMYSAVR
jgi:hypothetical protein